MAKTWKMVTVKDAVLQPGLVQSGGKSTSLYHRKYDAEVLKEAEDCGYFVTVDQRLIEKYFAGQEKANIGKKEFENVRFLALNCIRVRRLDGLSACRNLTVLLLASNFITKIDALAPCLELLKLDLHGNQITKLPDEIFWKGLRRLRILHLHDNPIGKYRTVDGMSACPNLLLLTLSDTPLSVRRHYRHHIVNTIWSLKALDRHVISDEEIIEGAKFGGRFSARSPAFQLPLSAYKGSESADEAVTAVWRLIGRMNSILAHHSPVLIIQRYWRGCLTRAAIRWAIDTELWAAVTIQRRYRQWKAGIRRTLNRLSVPQSSSMSSAFKDRRVHTPISGKFNYDSYLMSRRPLSSAFNRFSPMPGTRARPPSANTENITDLPNTNISFDLAKLEMNVDKRLAKEGLENNETIEQATEKARETLRTISKHYGRQKQLQGSNPLQPKLRKIKSVKEFFGPVVSLGNSDGFENDDGDSPLAKFRLQGIREEVKFCDLREEIVEEKQSCGRFVRLSDDINHLTTNAQPKPKVSRVSLAEVRQREERKYQSAIWLACLYAVGKNYKRAEASEKAAQQAAYVRRLKETRDGARDRIRTQVADQQRKSAIINHIEQEGLFEDLQEKQTRSAQVALKYNAVRQQSAQFEKVRRYETAFANEFIGRTASCTEADFRFGEQEMREQRARMKKELVSGLREQTADMKDLRRVYMTERRSNLQNHGLAEKNYVRKKISTSIQERIEEAQNRVAELKRSKTDISDRRSKTVLFLPIVSDPRGPLARSRTCDEM